MKGFTLLMEKNPSKVSCKIKSLSDVFWHYCNSQKTIDYSVQHTFDELKDIKCHHMAAISSYTNREDLVPTGNKSFLKNTRAL